MLGEVSVEELDKMLLIPSFYDNLQIFITEMISAEELLA